MKVFWSPYESLSHPTTRSLIHSDWTCMQLTRLFFGQMTSHPKSRQVTQKLIAWTYRVINTTIPAVHHTPATVTTTYSLWKQVILWLIGCLNSVKILILLLISLLFLVSTKVLPSGTIPLKNNTVNRAKRTPKKQAHRTHQLCDESTNDESIGSMKEYPISKPMESRSILPQG